MNDHRVGALLENRYRVLRRIARGGTAAVYEGLDERLDRPVALKIMPVSYTHLRAHET